jgi:hypothetical protein
MQHTSVMILKNTSNTQMPFMYPEQLYGTVAKRGYNVTESMIYFIIAPNINHHNLLNTNWELNLGFTWGY